MKHGKIISFDGLGGSGKTTQINKLKEALESMGKKVFVQKFPNYDSPTGKIIKSYLDGGYGQNVPPDFVQSMYALDRAAVYRDLSQRLQAGEWIILDRSLMTGITYHGARYRMNGGLYWKTFIDEWYDIETKHVGMRVSDLSIYLQADALTALNAVDERAKETGEGRDVHELSTELTNRIVESFGYLIEKKLVKPVDVLDADNRRRSIDDVHKEILRLLQPLL